MMKLESVPGALPSCRLAASAGRGRARPESDVKSRSNCQRRVGGHVVAVDVHDVVGHRGELAFAVEANQPRADGDLRTGW